MHFLRLEMKSACVDHQIHRHSFRLTPPRVLHLFFGQVHEQSQISFGLLLFEPDGLLYRIAI